MQRELVERVMRGDLEAFEGLVRASQARLHAMATLILRDAHRAEDAVQEALLEAWRDAAGLRDPGASDAWLYRLTVRSCYRAARRDRRVHLVELRLPRIPDDPDPDDRHAAVLDRDAIAQALGALPIDQRAVLVAHFYLDLPISSVAAVFGIPVGTCKSRLARGLAAAPADPATDVTATPTGSVIVIDADGGEARPVVTDLLPGIGTQAGGVAWAPDGDHIAYDRRPTPDGPAEIDVLSVADPHPVTVVGPGEHPAWSPDGRMLAYRVPDTGVYVVSAEGSGARQLSSGWSAGDYESWAWPS